MAKEQLIERLAKGSICYFPGTERSKTDERNIDPGR